MLLRPEDLPRDAAQLAAMVLVFAAKVERLQGEVAALKDLIFGARSEKLALVAPDQLPLDLGDTETMAVPANDDEPARERRSSGPRKPAERNIGALPKHLPRCERVIEPECLDCPCCGGRLHKIGEDASEALDVVPAIYQVVRTIRPKYACRGCEEAVVQAPAPARPVDGGLPTTALVAQVVALRFGWHMPYHRQMQMLAGMGIRLDRSTLASWAKRAAWWLEPLYRLLLAEIHRQGRIFCDETPMPVLEPGKRTTHTGQFWTHAMDDRPWGGPAPPAVAYVYADGRGMAHITEQLQGYEGILQVDGYGAYKALAKRQPKITLAFCLAHARRKFIPLARAGSPVAFEVLMRISAIYAIEKRVRGKDAAHRLAVRRAESAPIMAGLKTYLVEQLADLSQGAPLAEAIRYTLGHYEGLCRVLDDGRVEVDSNTVERNIKPIALGRRNALFAGSEGGAKTWAILASLVNSAKLNGLDPHVYLSDVLERVVSGRTKTSRLAELLPWSWKAAREATA